ncbi:hypothetical protein LINPERHAP1_LOCUS32204, partial [Linum perenne]
MTVCRICNMIFHYVALVTLMQLSRITTVDLILSLDFI